MNIRTKKNDQRLELMSERRIYNSGMSLPIIGILCGMKTLTLIPSEANVGFRVITFRVIWRQPKRFTTLLGICVGAFE